MDEQLIIDVCVTFGQHVKFTVTLPTQILPVSEVNALRNAFTIMMASQRALDMTKFPPKISERNSNGYGALVVYHMVNDL